MYYKEIIEALNTTDSTSLGLTANSKYVVKYSGMDVLYEVTGTAPSLVAAMNVTLTGADATTFGV